MEIRVSDLGRYGLPESVLNLWRHRQGETLLPVQRRAIRHGLLDRAESPGSRNMLISAPTSAGKSFCAEMAAVKALGARQKVVLLFPLKSLAEQQYRGWLDTYGPLGVRSIIVSGDHPENDAAFRRGDYQVALAIYEKLDLALCHHLDLLQTIGLIVVDEIQMIREPGRGAVLERLLTMIRASCYRPNLIALTGTLSDANLQPLADWLDADIIEETVRPRDLVRGVAAGSTLKYRSFNGDVDGQQALSSPVPESGAEDNHQVLVTWLLQQMEQHGLPALVFLKSRADAIALALSIASRSHWPEAHTAIALLADHEPSALHRTLRRTLTRGVAFHSADLSRQERAAIEKAFINNEIKVLCSTTTLSMGVDLPAEAVFLETVKYAAGGYGGRAELIPISRTEFENMTGRAGRYDRNHPSSTPGQAVILADSLFDQEVLWRNYITPTESTVLESSFGSLSLDDWVLHVLVSGLAKCEDDLLTVFNKTYFAQLTPNAPFDIAGAVNRLESAGMIAVRGESASTDRLASTPVGRVSAQTGLGVNSAAACSRLLASGLPDRPFDWLCLALCLPSLELPPGMLAGYEFRQQLPLRFLCQRLDQETCEAPFILPERSRQESVSFAQMARLKAALLLDDWRRLVPLAELEERYRVHLGQIQGLASSVAHALFSVGAVVGATGRGPAIPDQLIRLSFSVRYGLPENLAPVVALLGDRLGRSMYERLHRSDLCTPQDVLGAGRERLMEIGFDEAKTCEIMEILQSSEEEDEMRTQTINTRVSAAVTPQSLEIDGGFEGDRFLVRINGFPVPLTGKSFKYLTKLAWSRLNQNSGWIFKEDIEIGFNQARYMYRMKNEINAALSSDWPIVENNRLGYYRLNLPAESIRLNIEQLRNHPDYEVSSLFAAAGRRDAVN